MKIPKPAIADVERFRTLVPVAPAVEVKPMFGNLGAFVNGNMFMGLFGSAIGLKLDPDAAAALLGEGAGPFGPAERPMGGYVSIPNDWGKQQASPWVAKALDHIGALPAKQKKSSRKR